MLAIYNRVLTVYAWMFGVTVKSTQSHKSTVSCPPDSPKVLRPFLYVQQIARCMKEITLAPHGLSYKDVQQPAKQIRFIKTVIRLKGIIRQKYDIKTIQLQAFLLQERIIPSKKSCN